MLHTLKGKFSLVYISLVFLIALVGSVSAVNMVALQKSVNGLLTENYQSISAMEQSKDNLYQLNIAILQYLDLNDESGIDQYSHYHQAFQAAFQQEQANVTEPGEQKIVNSIVRDFSDLERDFSVFQNRRDLEGKASASAYYQSTIQPRVVKINEELDKITSINQSAMFSKKSQTAQDARASLYTILGLSLLAVFGGFMLSSYLVRRFLRPIHLLTESISKIRAGELHIKLDIRTGDETEKLTHEFNEMIERLSAFEESTLGTLMDEKNKSVAIVKSISDPLIVLDKDFKIVMANSACEQFFDFNESNALGRHFLEVIRDGELFTMITYCVESPETICERVLHFEKGNDTYFNVVVTKNFDKGQRAKGCVILMQNVTVFKELERIKTDFVATVSHEFKTPLTSIIMGASMLEGGNLGILTSEQNDVVKAMIEDGEKLSGFVTELLEVSKLESGRAIYSFEPCSLSAIIEDSIRQFAETASTKQVTILNDVEEKLPAVYADFERITWVMNNLLGNALKYTKSGDFITISAKIKDGFTETFVKDTGDGIPSEYLDRIFDKFVQVKGHDIEARGTGLGLAVAKEIVTAHGGDIHVESEMDVGSTFHFTLPLVRNRMSRREGN